MVILSHARRLAILMAGIDAVSVVDLSKLCMVFSEDMAAGLTNSLMEALKVEYNGETLVVFNVFDNVSYLQVEEERWSRLKMVSTMLRARSR